MTDVFLCQGGSCVTLPGCKSYGLGINLLTGLPSHYGIDYTAGSLCQQSDCFPSMLLVKWTAVQFRCCSIGHMHRSRPMRHVTLQSRELLLPTAIR